MEVTVRGVSFQVQDDEFAAFWRRVCSGDWEPDSFAVLESLLEPGGTFVDVGAWIGPLSLYAAARGISCHSVEPDPTARTVLLANLARNPELAGHVTVDPVAVAECTGPARLGNITSVQGGDSMSSLLFADGRVSWVVDGVRLEDLLTERAAGPVALLKMDIEGAEVEVLSGSAPFLARSRPPLFLSVHARFWPDPLARMTRLLDVLSTYRELLTPALEPVDPRSLLDDEHLRGLFELVAL
ncbi:FkbM family methyltransferase [Geodermatophilus sp. SYSU D00804]